MNSFSESVPIQITVLIASPVLVSQARVNTFNSTFLPTEKMKFTCNTFLVTAFRTVTAEQPNYFVLKH
jgi:hypothetical protein